MAQLVGESESSAPESLIAPLPVPVEMAKGISIMKGLEISVALAPYKKRVDALTAASGRAVVNNPETELKASEFCTQCRNIVEQLETFRKSVKKPIDDYAKFIQKLFLPIQEAAETASKLVAGKARDYRQAEQARIAAEQAEIRRKQEEEAQKMAEELEKAGNTAAAEAVIEAAVMAPVAPAAPPAIRNSFGTKFVDTVTWQGEVERPMEVLKAIVDGKLPISLIEWRQSELNKLARELKVETTTHGVKIKKSTSSGVR